MNISVNISFKILFWPLYIVYLMYCIIYTILPHFCLGWVGRGLRVRSGCHNFVTVTFLFIKPLCRMFISLFLLFGYLCRRDLCTYNLTRKVEAL